MAEITITPATITFPVIAEDESSPTTGAKIHSGIYKRDYQLSEHFKLSDFKRDGRYKVSEVLIERLETVFKNFSRVKGISIKSAYRTKTDTNSKSMHHYGCAIDIRWLDEDDKLLDPRYIAPAAALIGFGGIGCLEDPDGKGGYTAKTIHLDVRHDHDGRCWYGYERESPNNPGWYEGYGSNTAYGNPAYFYKRYNLTEEQVIAYLGNAPSLPITYEIFLSALNTTSATFNVPFSDLSVIDSIKYSVKNLDSDEAPSEYQLEIEHTDTDNFSPTITLQELVPGTNYNLCIAPVSTSREVSSQTISFSTLQDYPINGELGMLTSTDANGKCLSTSTFKTAFSVPSNYDCYWESYWTANKPSFKDYKGYELFAMINGKKVAIINSNTASGTVTIKPSDYNITFGSNLQIGLQTWINTNKLINAKEHERVYSSPIYTNSVYLESLFPMIKSAYVNVDNKFVRVMISNIKGGT